MALQKQTLVVNFGQGIDTKTDPKQVVPGDLLALTNGTFDSPKRIKKRNGYTALTQNKLGGGTVSTGSATTTYNGELDLLDGKNLYSYATHNNEWVSKGSLLTSNLTTQQIVRNINGQSLADSALNSNLQAFAWLDSGGSLNYSIFDVTTQQSLVNNAVLAANGTKVKVLSLGTNFIFVYYDSGLTHLNYKAVNVSTPTVLGSAVTIASDIETSTAAFDCTIINSTLYVAYNGSTARISLYSLSSGLVLSSQLNIGSSHAVSLSVVGDASFNVWVFYATATTVNGFIVNAALNSTLLAQTLIETISTVIHLTGFVSGTTGTVFYDKLIADADSYVRSNTLTFAGTAGTAAYVIKSVGLYTKCFVYSSTAYFWVCYVDNKSIQQTYFLVDQSGNIISKLSQGNGGAPNSLFILPEVNLLSTGIYQSAFQVKDSLASLNGNLFTQTGIQSASVTMNSTGNPHFVLANNLLMTGSEVNMYDGGSVVEEGFHVFPDVSTTAPVIAAGGAIGLGRSTASVNTFQYQATYEWTDNKGQIHRSAPSEAVTVDFGGNTTTIESGTLTNSSAVISSLASTTGIASGMFVNSLDVGPNGFSSTVVSVDSTTQVTAANNFLHTTATHSLLFSSQSPAIFTGTATINSAVITSVNFFAQTFYVGQTIISGGGTGVPFVSGTYIKAIDTGANTITVSTAALFSITGGAFFTLDLSQVTVVIPTLRLTAKSNVSIVLYRTTLNGTLFYRVSSVTSPTLNDKTANTVTIVDAVADPVLIGNNELYTNGGELENIAPPACFASSVYKNRALLIPSESPNSWWYSKEIIPGSPIEFNDSLVENVDSSTGVLTAIGAMDDKIVLFKNSSILYVYGNGPAPSGANNDFSEAQIIATDTGCNNAKSVVLMPMGLMFQSPKGIYLLDRSLQTHYLGAPVEAYNQYTVTSARHMETLNQVRFTLSNGQCLVYDYYISQLNQKPTWSVFSNISAVDTCIYNGNFTYITSGGVVEVETPGTFTDNGSFIQLSLTTSWLSLAGFQGYQRVWRFLIIGDYKSPHTLDVNVATDFASSFSQNVAIPVSSPVTPYQFRIHMLQQKCETLQIQIQDSQISNFGEGFDISGITLEVGAKVGADKLPAAASYG